MHDVVGDLHEVVDFGAFADDGGAKRAAVNRHVGADFNVVVNDNLADLRNFSVDAAVRDVAKAVGANDRARVDANARPICV